jgi:hypothetical protein
MIGLLNRKSELKISFLETSNANYTQRKQIIHYRKIPKYRIFRLKNSIADPGCLSRIPDPDFYPSRIPFYVATNFTKLNIILVLKRRRQKFWPIFKEIKNFLPKKFSLLSKILVWDPGSEIRDP